CFKVTDERSRPGCKVLYDCHGSIGGQPVPATCARFQEAILGEGALLPAFERALSGMGQGEDKEFDMAFPEDYGQPELAGKTVSFRVYVHHILQPVTVKRYENLKGKVSANAYALADTEGLQQYNIHLYYKVTGGAVRQGWKPPMPNALMLMNLFLTLGFVDRAEALMEDLPQNPVALSHGAHIFRVNGQPEKALELLDRAGRDGPRGPLIRAQALFDLKRLEEAEALVKDMETPNDVELADLQVELASRLCLPMETLLERKERLLDAKVQAHLQTRR
ncbi:MAG: FKBP-type peptidyl-prolyl cis-trans isomerase, partial [Thermodesulfobacteriota bacterium]|nr:FKBP-type peptidyl-prolyl cis-trans isomerase [Thermodesulfobacteriota bacterium]